MTPAPTYLMRRGHQLRYRSDACGVGPAGDSSNSTCPAGMSSSCLGHCQKSTAQVAPVIFYLTSFSPTYYFLIIIMKQFFYAAGFVASVAISNAYAQTAPQPPPVQNRIQINEQSVVKSASGSLLPYVVWRQMVGTGDYTLKAAPDFSPASPVFVVVQRTPAEREQYLSQLPAPQESPFFTTGHTIAPFKLRDVNGHKFDSKELKGKIVVLNFWFIRCGPCRMEIPELNTLVKQYADREDVVFLAVALDERADIQDFVRQYPYDYALIPAGRYVAQGYGIKSYPTNLVLDREGKVVFHAQYHPNMAYFLQKAIDNVP
nr:TlpA disulfide reductase family protein [Hymenobacter citatus]